MSEPASRDFVPFSSYRKRDVAARFWSIVGQFWRGPGWRQAWFFSALLAMALVLVVLVNLGINRWQSALFNALEARDGNRAWMVALFVPLLVLAGAGAGALVVFSRETIQVFWREYVVDVMVSRWLGKGRYRAIQENGREPPNPEYRIADDVRVALDPLVDFAIGFFSAGLALIAFIGILWGVGGSMSVTIGGSSFNIPAFMVIAAVVYGALVSCATLFVGRPLVDAIASKNESEARLRFDLMQVREHAETVRAEQSAGEQQGRIRSTYDALVARSRQVVRYHTRITWLTNGNGVLVPIFALVLAMPKYMAGGLSLGDLVSLGAAFHQAQAAFSWIVDNFRQLALWYASAGRVVDLIHALEDHALEDKEADTPPLPHAVSAEERLLPAE